MASLSNINGLFDVHSTGAILFSTSHGTSGQILKSSGDAAPTWVNASTVIGGPYVPIAGDVTINGYITLAAGKILTVGGNLFVTGTSTLTGAVTITQNSGSLQFANTGSGHASITTGLSKDLNISSASGTVYINNNTTFAGNVQASGTNITVLNSSDPSLTVSDTDTNYRGTMRYNTTSNVLEFVTRYASTYYTNNLVLDRGNVGIGTGSPFSSAKLDVNGNIYAKATAATVDVVAYNTTSGLANSDLHLAVTSSGEGQVRMYGNYPLTFYTNNTEKMRIDATGNVGIGETSPDAKLEVRRYSGDRTTLSTIIGVTNEGSGPYNGFGGKISFNSNIYYGATTPGIIETAYVGAVLGTSYETTSDLVFGTRVSATSVTEKMRILGNGNVTIGTTNNAAKLNVGGRILASDDGQTAGMYVTRNLTISHPGSSGTFTRTFNPVTQFGISRTGGAVKIMASGWQGKLQAGYIVWRNAGGGGNITAVYYYPSASSGLGETITVGVNAANNNTIDVTFTYWHSNSHGWYTKISVTQ